jgi:hypothetical protein
MANNPLDFPFLVGALDPDQPNEQAGGSDQFPGPPNLPLITAPAVRFWPLYDIATRTIRMWKSTDTGHTWTQLDSLNAPVTPANGTGPATIKIWQYYNAVWDGADLIYVVAFDAATFNVALFPFKISTGLWQASIVSALTYLDQTISRVSGVGGMAACFRPSDGAVWMAFQAGGADADDTETLWGAKCIPGGPGWDLALTRIGGTLHDGLFHTSGSLALDPATNKIHACYQRTIFGTLARFSVTTAAHVITASSITAPGAGYPFPTVVQGINTWGTTGDNITGGAVTSLGPTFQVGQPSGAPDGTVISVVPSINGNGSLVHRVINPDDSLTAEETIFDLTSNGISNNLSNLKIAGGQMMVTFTRGAGTFSVGARRKVARALIGDAPGWEVTEPAAANNVGNLTGALPAMMDIVRQGGVDFLLYGFIDNTPAGNAVFEFATSPGIGSGWSAGTFVAFGDNSTGPVFFGDAPLIPVGAELMLGVLPFGMGAGSNFGQGYYEFGAPVPPPHRCEVGIMKGVGVIIKDWQGKAYMNDFVPAELIFGFDNSQTPGLVYPEIYIPKNQALYLDVAPFGPLNGLLTLTFKGKKVYE